MLARETLDGADEQLLQTLRQERAPEKLDRLSVLVTTLADVDLPQVGGELGLLVAPLATSL